MGVIFDMRIYPQRTLSRWFFLFWNSYEFSHSCDRFWFSAHQGSDRKTPTKQHTLGLIVTIDVHIGMWVVVRVNDFISYLTRWTEQLDNFPESHSKIDDEIFLITRFYAYIHSKWVCLIRGSTRRHSHGLNPIWTSLSVYCKAFTTIWHIIKCGCKVIFCVVHLLTI